MHELSDEDCVILAMLNSAFADVTRPEHFTNHEHCEECADHDRVLLSRNRQTISRMDLGQTGWDPISFVSPQGFAYYFPALARVALEHATSSRDDWYVVMLLAQLLPRATERGRKQFFSPAQRAAVAEFLRHLLQTREHELKYQLVLEDAQEALRNWE